MCREIAISSSVAFFSSSPRFVIFKVTYLVDCHGQLRSVRRHMILEIDQSTNRETSFASQAVQLAPQPSFEMIVYCPMVSPM